MRILAIAALALAAATGSATAFAADARLSDAQFVQLSRCRGLASGDFAEKLAVAMKAQKRGRADFVIERAWGAQTDAARLARTDAAAAQAALAADCDRFGV